MRLVLFGCLLCLIAPATIQAALVGYEYTGSVSFVAPVFPPGTPPYGVLLPANTTVCGHFWYDTSAVGTPGATSATTNYWQPHDLTLVFKNGTTPLINATADGYRMEVSNDLPQGPVLRDLVSLVFQANLGLPSNWTVNGLSQADGLLRLTFMAGSASLQDQSVPVDFSFATLPQPGQLFADTAIGALDAIFTIETLIPIPEPSTISLAFGALLIFLLRWSTRIKSLWCLGHAVP